MLVLRLDRPFPDKDTPWVKEFNDKRISSCTLYSHDHLHVNLAVIFLCHGLTNKEEERLDFFPDKDTPRVERPLFKFFD